MGCPLLLPPDFFEQVAASNEDQLTHLLWASRVIEYCQTRQKR